MPNRAPSGEAISHEIAAIASIEQRGAALQSQALALFAEADERRRLLELSRLELPEKR